MNKNPKKLLTSQKFVLKYCHKPNKPTKAFEQNKVIRLMRPRELSGYLWPVVRDNDRHRMKFLLRAVC